jgi:hypothetical protein
MGTEGINLAPQALSSPQLPAEKPEIETTPESAEVTTATPTTGKPDSGVDVKAPDSHRLAMQETIGRVLDLAGQYLVSKNKYNKVRLDYGRELYTLQELLAKPGCGTFVDKLTELRKQTKISQSTAYALIREYKVSAGLIEKDPPPPPPGPAESLSSSRKDETIAREEAVGVVPGESESVLQLRIPSSTLKAWDDAVAALRGRPGYESADVTELVIEAVLGYADVVTVHQVQAQEDSEEKKQSGKSGPAFIAVAPAPPLENAIKPVPMPMAIAPPTPRAPLTFSSDDEEVR